MVSKKVMKPSIKMRFRIYDLISEAVDTGIEFGVNRSFKHSDNPTMEAIKNNVQNEVMLALGNVIDFEKSQ